jgi:5-methyltetrahydropteroyltriglutamate--homocysteine methyltransferase
VKIETTLAGSYPKLPTSPGDINLRVVRNRRDQGKATDQDVLEAIRQTTRRILEVQERAGIDLPVDGAAGWDDGQTYVARALGGFQIAGLIRYLDTNTYYRQPEIIGPIVWKGPITVEDFRVAQSMAERSVKAFLPGPYSLYRFSKDRHYTSEEEALAALGAALAREASALEEAGARWIHFEEPWLGHAGAEDGMKVRAALEPVLSGRTAKTTLHVPFTAPTAVFDTIRDLPWTALGLDLREAPAGWDLLPRIPEGRMVALGLVDARNTKLEEADEVAREVARARAARPDLAYQLSTTASLEYLPADKAELKVARLVEAAHAASRNGGS